jgi:hypothetical protein
LNPEDLLVIEAESHLHDHNDDDEQQQQDDGSEERAEEASYPVVDLLLRASDHPAILDSLVDKPDMENVLVELPASLSLS